MVLLSSGFLWLPSLSNKITHQNLHIPHGIIVLIVILVASLTYKYSLKSVEEELVPPRKFGLKNIMQVLVEGLMNLFRSVISHNTEAYFPVLAAIFIYILISNLLGMVPGILPPTENINTNLAVALTIFVYYHYVGIKQQGFKHYMAHFCGPSLGDGIGMVLLRLCFLAPLMFFIELISHSVRPVSLSLRLFGNITGDHMVLTTFNELTPLVIPVIFLAFGIFVSFIQAFVFTLLSTIYIGLAVVEADGH